MVAKPYNAFTLGNVEMTLLERPLFYVGERYVTILGLIAFAAFFTAGLRIAHFLQSQIVRRFFNRFKIDVNFIAIVATILSLASIIFFSVTAVNAIGIPLPWNVPLPAIKLSLLQIFLLVVLLIAVFWISSRTKRFLFNRLFADSGLDGSLQYAIAQIVSNVVLVVGIVIVLENTRIHLAALAVFAGAVGVSVGFGLQNIRPSRYRSDLNFAIEEKFREAGIEIAFPQRDLHIKSGVLKVENVSEREAVQRPEE